MQQTDIMLIATMKEYIVLPQNITVLADIKSQEIFDISLKILQYFRQQTQEIRYMAARQQKFRSMAKLNQTLQTVLDANYELNELMNPTVPFLRKFILKVINKFGQGDQMEKSKIIQRKQTDKSKNDEKLKQKIWLKEEWIHPSLIDKKKKYKAYLLPMTVNKNMIKSNINLSQQLDHDVLRGNARSIQAQTQAKLNQRVKQFEANQGFSRRQYEQSQIRLQNIVKTNKEDWLIGENKLHRIKKKIIQEKSNIESDIQAPTSVFKQELELAEQEAEKKKDQEEVKPLSMLMDAQTEADLNLNPLQLLKRQYESKRNQYETQIRSILDQLKQKKQFVDRWQQQKEQIQQNMISEEQKTSKFKKQTQNLKKHVEKRQTILATLEGQKNIQEEVEKLQEEIRIIESEAKKQTKRIQKQMKEMQVESKQKMDVLTDLKIKLNRIQSDYTKICEQIVEKEELKKNVKIRKSGISRLYYHKKISQMEQRWRQTQKQTKKLKANLQEMRQKTRMSSTLSIRVQIEIQNILNVQKTRNEPQMKNLRQLMAKCKQAYEATMKTIQEANSIKMQTQEYEVKVHTLSGKNYKQNIERIRKAIDDLNRELRDIGKSNVR